MGSNTFICDLLAWDLLYPPSVKYRAGKDQDPVKMLKFNVNLLFVFVRISVKKTFIATKIVFIKNLNII